MDLWPIELRDPVFLTPKPLMYDVCLSFKRLTIRHLFAKMEPGAEFQNASQVCTIKYEGRQAGYTTTTTGFLSNWLGI